jgi:hypothetical protein
MDGRVLAEGLLEGPDPEEVRVGTFRIESDPNPGLEFSTVNGVTYFEGLN